MVSNGIIRINAAIRVAPFYGCGRAADHRTMGPASIVGTVHFNEVFEVRVAESTIQNHRVGTVRMIGDGSRLRETRRKGSVTIGNARKVVAVTRHRGINTVRVVHVTVRETSGGRSAINRIGIIHERFYAGESVPIGSDKPGAHRCTMALIVA